jgi:hypothetical protein
MTKVLCSRFLPIGTHVRFLPLTTVIQIFVHRKNFKLISLTFKILETPGCPNSVLFDHRKFMVKVVCSRFLPVGTHTCFLHRTIIIQIFVYRKDFKLISLALKILETLRLS